MRQARPLSDWLARLALIATMTAVTSGAAAAEELAEHWEILGTFTVTLDEEETRLYAVRNTDTGDATLSRDNYSGAQVIQVTGVKPNDDGEPGVPILTATLGPYLGELPEEVSIDLREADRVLMANIDSETSATLNAVSLDDEGNLSFVFEAELAVMTPTADGAFEPAAGAVPTMVTGSFEGRLPHP